MQDGTVASSTPFRQRGDTVPARIRTWYDRADGTFGTAARGDYQNLRTGTTGRYAAGRSYNPDTGVAQRGYGRTLDTAGGVDGGVARGERCNPAIGVRSYGSSMSATGPASGAVSRDTERARGPLGGSAAAHQASITNPRTGETRTLDCARVGINLLADRSGNVYRNTGDGWQRHDDSGWQDTSLHWPPLPRLIVMGRTLVARPAFYPRGERWISTESKRRQTLVFTMKR